jgi:TolB-like protein
MTEDAVAIGKMLSVDYVLIGSLDKLGNKYILSMRMIDIKLNRVVASERLEHADRVELITGKIRNSVREITLETVKSVR